LPKIHTLKKELFILFSWFTFAQITYSQTGLSSDYKYVHMNPSVGFGMGTTYYFGDLSKDKTLAGAKIASLGNHLTYAHPFSKSVVGQANVVYNRIGQFGVDTIGNYHNFKTNAFGVDVGGRYRLDNDKVFSSQSPFTVFIGAGIGVSYFGVREDRMGNDNAMYNFWSDGTIRNVAEDDVEAPNAQVVYRDYIFESKIDTRSNMFLYSYTELGVGLKITSNLNALFSYKHIFTFTDELDGISLNGKKDKLIYLSVGLSWYFGYPERTNQEIIAAKVAQQLHLEDEDEDGVPDVNDLCPRTPKGWEVDVNGCLLDDDGDGVPNKLDKEPNTPIGNIVNKYGVTITDEEIEVMYLLQVGEMTGHPNFNDFKNKYPDLFEMYFGKEVIKRTETISE
jgi:hypothetical protein